MLRGWGIPKAFDFTVLLIISDYNTSLDVNYLNTLLKLWERKPAKLASRIRAVINPKAQLQKETLLCLPGRDAIMAAHLPSWHFFCQYALTCLAYPLLASQNTIFWALKATEVSPFLQRLLLVLENTYSTKLYKFALKQSKSLETFTMFTLELHVCRCVPGHNYNKLPLLKLPP